MSTGDALPTTSSTPDLRVNMPLSVPNTVGRRCGGDAIASSLST
jgi:hypothetical protein